MDKSRKLRNKKTGEIGYLLATKGLERYDIVDDNYCLLARYDFLIEVGNEWEDYEPVEPLIKDLKICKLVKEWATLFEEHRKIKYYEYNDFVAFRLCRKEGTHDPELDISIDYELVNLREGYEYDFEELCGEEEECES